MAYCSTCGKPWCDGMHGERDDLMLNISPNWTEAERLAVITAKSRVLLSRMESPIVGRGELFNARSIVEEIHYLSYAPAEVLEDNRRRLLEGVE